MLAVELLGKRKRLGVNQVELAKALNIHEIAVSAVETGLIGVDIETYQRFDNQIEALAKTREPVPA